MRRRQGLRAQMRTWNSITKSMQAAAQSSGARCGCSVNAPEADPSKFPCPCGSHCTTCKVVARG